MQTLLTDYSHEQLVDKLVDEWRLLCLEEYDEDDESPEEYRAGIEQLSYNQLLYLITDDANWNHNHPCHHWNGRVICYSYSLSTSQSYLFTLLQQEMIRINYYCNFLNSDRSLFVFSEKTKDKEIERLNKLEYTIHSIEYSNDTWNTFTYPESGVSNPLGTESTEET